MTSLLAYVPLQCFLVLPWLHGVPIDFAAINSFCVFAFCLLLLFMIFLLSLCPRFFFAANASYITRYSALQTTWALGFNALFIPASIPQKSPAFSKVPIVCVLMALFYCFMLLPFLLRRRAKNNYMLHFVFLPILTKLGALFGTLWQHPFIVFSTFVLALSLCSLCKLTLRKVEKRCIPSTPMHWSVNKIRRKQQYRLNKRRIKADARAKRRPESVFCRRFQPFVMACTFLYWYLLLRHLYAAMVLVHLTCRSIAALLHVVIWTSTFLICAQVMKWCLQNNADAWPNAISYVLTTFFRVLGLVFSLLHNMVHATRGQAFCLCTYAMSTFKNPRPSRRRRQSMPDCVSLWSCFRLRFTTVSTDLQISQRPLPVRPHRVSIHRRGFFSSKFDSFRHKKGLTKGERRDNQP